MEFPLLNSEEEIIKTLRENISPATKDLLCYFSSTINAFITDPLFMNVPMEDKIVHRGYSVFDAIKIYANKIYQIDMHLNRFEKSINYINLKSKYTNEQYKNILIRLASIARSIEPNLEQDIELRIYYSAGIGNYSVVVDDTKHTFYAIALKAYNEKRPVNGTNEYTVNIDKLKEQACKSKNTNYLINSMTTKMSKDQGGFLGIMTTDDGFLLESSMSNCAFLMKDGSFCIPPFDRTLAGTTAIRCMDYIVNTLIPEGKITKLVREYVNINDLYDQVSEMMLLGGSFLIPILSLNGKKIVDQPGEMARRLQKFLSDDKGEEESFEPIPKF
jgi:branched-subunit amino acid aminotransferase/4-amino-4-deoxychorismate lyase